MISIDLTKDNIDIIALHTVVSKLQSNEFCYIKVNTINSLPASFLNLIHASAKKSCKVAISLPYSDVETIHISTAFDDLKVHTLCLRVRTNPEKFADIYNYGSSASGDRDLINSITHKIFECPKDHEISLEFNYEDDFRVLGSTITLLHESGINWMTLIPPAVITESSLKNYRELFDFLRMRQCYKLNLYFDFLSPVRMNWQLQTLNTFSGLREVHIDVSNKCTHSCVFCGLYSPYSQEAIQKNANPAIMKEVSDQMKMEIDGDKALTIIHSLPFDVEKIQFGGMGDPLMHANAIDFIAAARSRGFNVEVLSNMEYLDEEKIITLSSLGNKDKGLNFIVNISGGSAETFIKTRPKQTEKNFDKITQNLKKLSLLRADNNNKGAWLTILCIVTKNNASKLAELAQYALDIKAHDVWYKPMEVHLESMRAMLPDAENQLEMKVQLKLALELLDTNHIEVLAREYCEEIIRQ